MNLFKMDFKDKCTQFRILFQIGEGFLSIIGIFMNLLEKKYKLILKNSGEYFYALLKY